MNNLFLTCRNERTPLWRIALVGDLALLSLAVAAFAYFPLFPPEPGELVNGVTTEEAFITVAGILVTLGLLLYLSPMKVRGTRWAYLASSVLALVTAGIFFGKPPESMAPGLGLVIGLVLASNVIGGAAAHLVDGGRIARGGDSGPRPE